MKCASPRERHCRQLPAYRAVELGLVSIRHRRVKACSLPRSEEHDEAVGALFRFAGDALPASVVVGYYVGVSHRAARCPQCKGAGQDEYQEGCTLCGTMGVLWPLT